jgi:hypothetical protein
MPRFDRGHTPLHEIQRTREMVKRSLAEVRNTIHLSLVTIAQARESLRNADLVLDGRGKARAHALQPSEENG